MFQQVLPALRNATRLGGHQRIQSFTGVFSHRGLSTRKPVQIGLPEQLQKLQDDINCKASDVAKAMEEFIGPQNIVRCENGTIIFRYRDRQYPLIPKIEDDDEGPLTKSQKASCFNTFIYMGVFGRHPPTRMSLS